MGVKGVLEKRSCNLTTPQFLHALWLQTEMIPFSPPSRIEYGRRASLEIYIYAQTPRTNGETFYTGLRRPVRIYTYLRFPLANSERASDNQSGGIKLIAGGNSLDGCLDDSFADYKFIERMNDNCGKRVQDSTSTRTTRSNEEVIGSVSSRRVARVSVLLLAMCFIFFLSRSRI